MIGYFVLGIFLIVLGIVIVRAIRFKPYLEKKYVESEVKLDEDKIISDMVDFIKCKTISYRDEELIDYDEFIKFRELLPVKFPTLFQKADYEQIGKSGMLFRIHGRSSAKPSVCMAHYDVVPVTEENWTRPAFEGLIEDGCIWGRGTLDTKGTLLSTLEAAEQLLKEGFIPNNDLYFSFSGGEEVDGLDSKNIVDYLHKKGVKPAIVLDEGGAVVENALPGLSFETAMVGIAEKGSTSLDICMESNGGHASTPPKHTELGKLAKAVVKIENNPFKMQITEPVLQMFDILGRYMSFPFKMIFANIWLFKPLLNIISLKSGGELNAMFRTTCAITVAKGSDAYNVLPVLSKFGMNLRLMGDDTVESAIEHLNKIIDNDDISVKIVQGTNPSIVSDTKCDEWEMLKETIKETWPEAVVSPYLMMACSDSRTYCEITDRVYRFCPMKLSKEERKMIHGNDERVPIETLIKTVKFYVRFIGKL